MTDLAADPLVAGYLFCLGLAAGLAALALSVYATVSPRWLRNCLIACGLLVASRYVVMALCTTRSEPALSGALRRLWLTPSFGLTFPGVVALDQLIRHPAMTPKKLATWYAPFFAAYALVLLFGRFELVPDRIAGIAVELAGWGRWVLGLAQASFVAAIWWIGLLLARKLPFWRIRIAIAGLLAAYAYLALDGVLVSLGRWYVRPFLFSEMLAVAAIWFALDTAKKHTI